MKVLLTETPGYTSWRGLFDRCLNPENPAYENYGGRGISICDRWRFGEGGIHPFRCFMSDMGEKPSPKHSIDRIDVDGNYEPSNCRWADAKTQARNKRETLFATIEGETLPLAEWADRAGVDYLTFYSRIANHGMSPEEAFAMPADVETLKRQLKREPEPTIQLNVRIDPELAEELEKLAIKADVTKAAVVIGALKAHVERGGK